jgi:hypothetical protein
MKTYTTQEAAELTGSSVRGSGSSAASCVPCNTAAIGGFHPPSLSDSASSALRGRRGDRGQGTGDVDGVVLAELERERAERRRLAQEVARLRPLTAHVERITEDLHRERAERQAAEAKANEAADAAAELRERERELAKAGFFARRRMIHELRRQPA